MAINKNELENLIKQSFVDATYKITDLAGDDNHYQLEIHSKEFKGLNLVKQHKLVYQRLNGLMDQQLHALALKTFVIE